MAFVRILVVVLAVLVSASIAGAADSTLNICDPSCAEECKADFAECRLDVREHYKETLNECLDLNCRTVIARARRICAANPDSDDCANARAHAQSCIDRCKAVAQHQADEEIVRCKRAYNACLTDCRKLATPTLGTRQ